MTIQTPGKIFLADQRGLRENEQFRRYSTFNFESFQHEHKAPFGRLLALNDETLAPGHRLPLMAPQDAYLLVLPLTGAIEILSATIPALTVDVAELQLLPLPACTSVELCNPYDADLINFLHLWLTPDGPLVPTAHRFTFDLQNHANQLAEIIALSLTPALPFGVSLGRFDGRQEAIYKLDAANEQLFVFVIAGAFEVEGRLMHEKDGLALWETSQIELEALSNGALILILNVKK